MALEDCRFNDVGEMICKEEIVGGKVQEFCNESEPSQEQHEIEDNVERGDAPDKNPKVV